MKIKCQWCNEEFEAKRRDTKYCSRSCQAKASRYRQNNNINILEHQCGKCGKIFIIKEKAFNRRYCYECVPFIPKSGSENRKIIKLWALEYKGNKCQNCGYDKCIDALEFHHTNPQEKDFSISDRKLVLDWNKIKIELDKCILLCANCHRELHSSFNKGDDIIEFSEE